MVDDGGCVISSVKMGVVGTCEKSVSEKYDEMGVGELSGSIVGSVELSTTDGIEVSKTWKEDDAKDVSGIDSVDVAGTVVSKETTHVAGPAHNEMVGVVAT